jgi:tRNA pseudouridine38-40 synthase
VYEYRILNAPAPSPFWRRHAWHVPRALDVGAMANAAAVLVGEHDFAGFRAADAEVLRSTVRRALVSRIDREDELLVYRIEATAFLKHMVRNIVGTLVEVGFGARSPGDVAHVLASRDRGRAGATAPPHGLCLVAVRY